MAFQGAYEVSINPEAPVGIFDSGLGGLTVVRAFKEALPREHVVYLGDTARVPYGDKSRETVTRFGVENTAFLSRFKVKMIIVACNTVSSLAMEDIRTAFPSIPIIGVLEAGVDALASRAPAKIAVIGTRATVASRAYDSEIRNKLPDATVVSLACPLFAPIVEEGLSNHEIAAQAIEFYLGPLVVEPPDTLLLACTHYPLLRARLEAFLPTSVDIIDSADTVAKFASDRLAGLGMLNLSSTQGTERYFATDSPESFTHRAAAFLGYQPPQAMKAVVDCR